MHYRKFFTAALLLSTSITTFAWDATGHKLVAKIAYARLTPSARANINEITEAFRTTGNPLARFEFMATEPDLLRAQGDKTYANYHFIDLPYSLDGTPTSPAGDDNVVKDRKSVV